MRIRAPILTVYRTVYTDVATTARIRPSGAAAHPSPIIRRSGRSEQGTRLGKAGLPRVQPPVIGYVGSKQYVRLRKGGVAMAELMCGTCRWHDMQGFAQFYGQTLAEHREMGFCRRHPPWPDFTRLLDPSLREEPRYKVMVFAFWPETQAHDWCGEWQAKEPPAMTIVGDGGYR
jgi:hypothetical protein